MERAVQDTWTATLSQTACFKGAQLLYRFYAPLGLSPFWKVPLVGSTRKSRMCKFLTAYGVLLAILATTWQVRVAVYQFSVTGGRTSQMRDGYMVVSAYNLVWYLTARLVLFSRSERFRHFLCDLSRVELKLRWTKEEYRSMKSTGLVLAVWQVTMIGLTVFYNVVVVPGVAIRIIATIFSILIITSATVLAFWLCFYSKCLEVAFLSIKRRLKSIGRLDVSRHRFLPNVRHLRRQYLRCCHLAKDVGSLLSPGMFLLFATNTVIFCWFVYAFIEEKDVAIKIVCFVTSCFTMTVMAFSAVMISSTLEAVSTGSPENW